MGLLMYRKLPARRKPLQGHLPLQFPRLALYVPTGLRLQRALHASCLGYVDARSSAVESTTCETWIESRSSTILVGRAS